MSLTQAEMAILLKTRELPGAHDLLTCLQGVVQGRSDAFWFDCGELSYPQLPGYSLIRISSIESYAQNGWILVRAGIHGDEIAGPLMLQRHLHEMFDASHAAGFGLIVYPLDNPSGFDARLRYNALGDRGSEDGGNNDFLRYELDDGSVVGDMLGGAPFRRWLWASDPDLGIRLPLETVLVHRDLRRLDLSRIKACLDLHQDNFLAGTDGVLRAGAYHYAFDDTVVYRPIAERIAEVVPLLRQVRIGSGLMPPPHLLAALPAGSDPEVLVPTSDDYGFIVRHDGTLPDLMFRLGARHSITVETTGATGLDDAIEVNRIWFNGILGLLEQEGRQC
jgi:hypothetical protein